jgi:hypothetical protein
MTARLWAIAATLCLLSSPQSLFAAADAAGVRAPSRSSLFDDDALPAEKEAEPGATGGAARRQQARIPASVERLRPVPAAYTPPNPAHWSRVLTPQVDATGAFSPSVN